MGSGKRRPALRAGTAARRATTTRVASLTGEVQSLRKDLASTERELAALRAKSKAGTVSLRAARDERDRVAAALEEATAAQSSAEKSRRAAVAERARIETALRFAEAARQEAEANTTKVEEALASTKGALSVARAALTDAAAPDDSRAPDAEELTALETQLRLAADQSKQAASRIAELENSLKAQQAKAPDAPPPDADEKLLDGLRRKARDYERRLHLSEAETVAARRKVAELQQRLAENTSQLSAIAQRDRRIHELRDDKASLEVQVSTLEDTVADQHLRCPRCNEKMIEFDHHGVTLDRCEACDGLYFDAGELEQVIAAEYPALDSVPETTESANPFEADEDTLVDGPKGVETPKRGFFRTLFQRNSKQMNAVAPPDDVDVPRTDEPQVDPP